MTTTATLSAATRRAIKAYGDRACLEALRMHEVDGEGASTIALQGPETIRTTQQADAAINAGREMLAADYILGDGCMVKQPEAVALAARVADETGLPMTVVRAADTHGWAPVNSIVSSRIGRRTTLMHVTILPARYFA